MIYWSGPTHNHPGWHPKQHKLIINNNGNVMEISGEKLKFRTNNINNITTDIQIAGYTLDEIQSFKFLGAINHQ